MHHITAIHFSNNNNTTITNSYPYSNLYFFINLTNRCIREIQEGSKILEDQLRLMDEKYVELRIRFDQSRGVFQNNVNEILKDNAELRKKFSLAFGTNIMLDAFDSNKGGGGNRIRAKSANSATKSSLTAAATTVVTTSDHNRLQPLQQFSPDNNKYYKDDNHNLIQTTPNNNKNNFNSTTVAKSSKVNTPSNNSNYNNSNNNNLSSPERNRNTPLRRSVHLDIEEDNSITKGIKEKDVLKKIAKRAKKKEWSREQLQELIPKFS